MDDKQYYKEMYKQEFDIQHSFTHMESHMLTYHIHDVLEILFIIDGPTKCFINKKEVEVGPNTLLIFNNMDLHGLYFDKPCDYERYVLYFNPSFIETLSTSNTFLLECFFLRVFENPQKLVLDEKQTAELKALLDQLLSLKLEEYGYELARKFYVGLILLFINKQYRLVHEIKNTSNLRFYPLILKTLYYIYENISEELTLEELCSIAGMSRHVYCDNFKTIFGLSPMQYVKNCRLIKSKNLLYEGYSVEEVCDKAGFKNLSHFSRSFKEQYGISPKQYQLAENREKKSNE